MVMTGRVIEASAHFSGIGVDRGDAMARRYTLLYENAAHR